MGFAVMGKLVGCEYVVKLVRGLHWSQSSSHTSSHAPPYPVFFPWFSSASPSELSLRAAISISPLCQHPIHSREFSSASCWCAHGHQFIPTVAVLIGIVLLLTPRHYFQDITDQRSEPHEHHLMKCDWRPYPYSVTWLIAASFNSMQFFEFA